MALDVYQQETSALCISELFPAHDKELNTVFVAASVRVKAADLTFHEVECEPLLALFEESDRRWASSHSIPCGCGIERCIEELAWWFW